MNLEIVNMLALGLLVLVFASIVRRHSTSQLQLWFLGWVLILVDHIAVSSAAMFGVTPGWLLAVDASLVQLAGVSFLVAVSTVCGEPRQRRLLALAIAGPLLSYTSLVYLQVESKALYVSLVVAAIGGTIALISSFYRRAGLWVVAIITIVVTIGAAIVRTIVDGNIRAGVHVAEASLFLVCGLLYIRRFLRPSVGVITATAGFVIWAATFVQQSFSTVAALAPYFASFELSRYLLAFGMILTLLEEQLREQELASKRMEYLAQHDPLTGLPNRLLVDDRFTHALARARREESNMAVLCIDVDRFKQTNDMFGHHIGDLCLQEIARRFSGRLREKDTLGRTGGDEFMVVLEDLKSVSDSTTVAKALIDVMQSPIEVDGCNLELGASIGIAVFPHDGTDTDILRCAADHAMYRAKSRGMNQFELSTEDSRVLLDVELTMRRALENGGFELVYQPQVRPDGSIAGMESLLRLHHEKYGLLSPAKFIPVAENTGLIVPLGVWVLNDACRQGVEWIREFGSCPKIAVNVSPLQFARQDFAEVVEKALSESGFPSHLLELEVTETLVMNNVAESARQMERLKRIGVSISVDDFGTGYSSLAYLHTLPIDTLKVDRSFVEKMTDANGTRPIVETILSLARGLGMTTVAEGVETERQADLLKELGCDVLQGFRFFRPMAVADISQLIAKIKPQSAAPAAQTTIATA